MTKPSPARHSWTFSNDGVLIAGTAQQGQTLTAETSTNDPNASIDYQWQKSSDGVHWTAIDGATGMTYTLQSSDVGDTIEVVATTSDPGNPQPAATATSTATATVSRIGPAERRMDQYQRRRLD